MTLAWFGPKILWAGINPDSPAPVDTLETERMRKSMIPVMKEGRNHIDCHMLDLIAADDLVKFRVFAMLHTDEDRLRDVTIDIPDNQIADEIDSDGLCDLGEEELDEMFRERLHDRIRGVNRNRHIVRTRGPWTDSLLRWGETRRYQQRLLP